MIPSVLAQHVEQGVKDFLRTTFPVTTPHFDEVLERLLEEPGNVFKGPYLDIQLPFQQGKGGVGYFPDLPMKYPPYLHQEKAFDRLSGEDPKATIVATGTGSGKTESFLYPILDYCYRHRNEPGIKAILIYPMNALASDQAGRLASLIFNSKAKGHVTAGIYVGQQEKEPTKVMQEERLISDKSTMRLSPPDILLTNYKMLDYLLLRQEDKKLWEHNTPDSLRFLVVDELHTFDGAQGADLGCLIRRLKARLAIEEKYLCCVGTSATLGDGGVLDELLDYSSAVFGEEFTRASVVTEFRRSAGEFLADGLIARSDVIPAARVDMLDPESYESYEEYIRAQHELWLDEEIKGDFAENGWRIKLGEQLKQHLFFHNLIRILKGGVSSYEEIFLQFEKINKEFRDGDRKYQQNLLNSLLALISEARAIVLSYSSDGSTEEQYMPFLNVRLQLWLRELRRMVCEVAEQPVLRFADDLNDEQLNIHLPLVHCRECGSMGWTGLKKQNNTAVMGELKSFYQAFFKHDPKVVFIFPEKNDVREQAPRVGMYYFCPRCLHVTAESRSGGCGHCDHTSLLLVYMPDTRVKRKDKQASVNDCPYCNSRNSLTLLGSRAASLTSVMIVQLFSSTYNDDKKLLTFSDNVQDAAHRAGFFNGRTYRFNFRAALQQFILAGGDGLPLASVPDAFIEYWKKWVDQNQYISTFLAPNMEWFKDYEVLQQTGTLPSGSKLIEDIDLRIGWEINCEYGYQARIGRTLEKTGSSVVHLDQDLLDRVVTRLLPILQNEFGPLRTLKEEMLGRFILGFLVNLKNQGGIFQPSLRSYVVDYGNTYLLNRINWLPNFGRNSRSPSFLTTKSQTRFDTLHSTGKTHRTWYLNWADKSFAELITLVSGGETVSRDIYKPVLDALVEEKILVELESKKDKIWGISTDALKVSLRVSQYRCSECGHNLSVAEEEESYFEDGNCLRFYCPGTYSRLSNGVDYYGKLYATGDVARIFAREHTGLLARDVREQLEIDFKTEEDERKPWYPNLLSCTPTLEMGIDIGSLSSLVLCSVPPRQANYVQRIGRAGRRDGNALNLTVANARPHDLYFFADPKEMLAGHVESPGIFLDASAVLERQVTAFGFDRWVALSDIALVPKTLGKVLGNLDKVDPSKFPHNFIKFIETHQVDLFQQFLALFVGRSQLSDESVERLKRFVEGDSKGESGLRLAIMNGLHARKLERDSLQKKTRTLTKKIKAKKGGPKDMNYEEELRDLEIEKSALQSLVRNIKNRDTFNFFTDEGLLPNYAFPEVGVMLRSLIYRRKSKVQTGESNYETWHYDYERPAVAAIQELAPANTFYAGGRRVTIDQVDMAVSEVEAWRFCNNCAHKEQVGTAEERESCVVCGSPMWSDSGQKRQMLKLRQVFASTADNKSRISDDSDDRDPVFYNKQMLVEFDGKHVLDAFKIDADFPFGFDFISKVDFCEINFGEVSEIGSKDTIAGKEAVRKGFSLCKVCGKLQEKPEEPVHDLSCTARDKTSEKNLIECIYLYRQFTSEAIRILLPVSIIDESERKLQSLIAAIQFGLKLKFKGKIDHLQSTVAEEPLPDSALKRKYLVIYDSVPGGTGYLKQLMRSDSQLMEIFDIALKALRACNCNQVEGKDGCYRCLYVYKNSFYMPETSRDTAIDLLSEILGYREQLVRTKSLSSISFNSFLESELEVRFIGALKLYVKDAEGTFKNDLLNGNKPGYFFSFQDKAYYVEPQVELGSADGVAIASRADFVIRPARSGQGGKPIAVFLDGFAYHRDRVGQDMAQRMAIVQSGKFHAWSLTWYDVENKFESKGAYWQKMLEISSLPMGSKYDVLLQSFGVTGFKGLEQLNSFELLFKFLENPDSDLWAKYGFTLATLFSDHARFNKPGALEEWTTELETRFPYTISDVVKESECPCLYGHREYETDVDGKKIMSLLMVAEQAAIKPPQNMNGVRLGCWLDDSEKIRTDEEFRSFWNGYLALYNIFQFLGYSYFVTREGVADSVYGELKLAVSASFTERTSELSAADDPEWSEVKELTDDSLHELLNLLRGAGWPIPVVGYELEGEDGEIMASAELAWEDASIAFLEESELEFQPNFTKKGWGTYSIVEVLENPEKHSNLYTDKKD
ncbi:DEAD/DEAH box helicase [Desulfosediminicola ganghwensis]|uniref:DEAD/DEAH box helicase n=1 Tax=Desulfosediminicola ganghwensis TaxID=2569540 RepID=UPI0010ACE5B5|nr:DEAD/DEAH box helicase [Desulfosediminicola ganghwensis]